MKKILVIDDAEYILESTSTLLKFEGFDVITATNGLEGIKKSGDEKPDLIICDISMPGMDGYQVLESIRQNSDTKTTPFIFLTAFTDKSNMRAGMEKGADDYLVKPFTRDELVAAIEAQLKKSSYLEEQLQVKVDEFSRNITNALPHEFRTVLNQISGTAKYLNSNYIGVEREDIRELSQDIIVSTQRLLKITENYLIYARIESFSSSKSKREYLRTFKTDEPGAMLLDISYQIAQNYERYQDLDFEGAVTDITVEISTESFYKIVNELIDNAFKFSEPGAPVKISMNSDDLWFRISIEDNGRGMTAEQIAKVGAYIQFERKVYEQQGLGLGLSIAKKLVELHDGLFDITSETGKGTKIQLSLPCRKPD